MSVWKVHEPTKNDSVRSSAIHRADPGYCQIGGLHIDSI